MKSKLPQIDKIHEMKGENEGNIWQLIRNDIFFDTRVLSLNGWGQRWSALCLEFIHYVRACFVEVDTTHLLKTYPTFFVTLSFVFWSFSSSFVLLGEVRATDVDMCIKEPSDDQFLRLAADRLRCCQVCIWCVTSNWEVEQKCLTK